MHGTKREAEAELTRLLREADTGMLGEGGRVTVEGYAARYLDHAATRLRPRTLARYEQLLRLHVLPVVGAAPLARLRPLDVQAVIDRMAQEELAARTIVQTYRVLSAALQQAVRWRLLAVNPASAVQPPRPERPDLAIPSAADIARILGATRGDRLEVPVTLAAATGLRRGEVLALRWADVDLQAGVVRVQRTYEGAGRFREPKTSRGRRTVAVPPFVLSMLRRYRREQSGRRLLLGEAWQETDLIVERGDGSPVHPDVLSHQFARVAESVGLGRVRLHDLRHGYASMLLASSVHPKIVSEALGHASTAFTMDTYAHVLEGLGNAAAQAVESALGRRRVSKRLARAAARPVGVAFAQVIEPGR